jgi:hypothetical protein
MFSMHGAGPEGVECETSMEQNTSQNPILSFYANEKSSYLESSKAARLNEGSMSTGQNFHQLLDKYPASDVLAKPRTQAIVIVHEFQPKIAYFYQHVRKPPIVMGISAQMLIAELTSHPDRLPGLHEESISKLRRLRNESE